MIPRFSSIQSIIISCEKLIFLVSDLKTIEYISYKASYKLKEVEVMQKLFHYDDLEYNWPLDLYDLDNNFKPVCQKYPVTP